MSLRFAYAIPAADPPVTSSRAADLVQIHPFHPPEEDPRMID